VNFFSSFCKIFMSRDLHTVYFSPHTTFLYNVYMHTRHFIPEKAFDFDELGGMVKT